MPLRDQLQGLLVPSNHALRASLVALLTLAYAVALARLHLLHRYDCLFLPPLAVWMFACLEPLKHRTWALLAVTATLQVALLLHLWDLGYEGRTAVIGGIIPWSDAAGYLSDAERFLHGERLRDASRPFYSVFLGTLLRLTGNDLRRSLLLIVLLDAAAITLVTRELWRTHGVKAAGVAWLVLFLF